MEVFDGTPRVSLLSETFFSKSLTFIAPKNSLPLGSLDMFATYSKGDDFHDSLLSAEVNFDFFLSETFSSNSLSSRRTK